MSVLTPRSARSVPRLAQRVVFPTPSLVLPTVIVIIGGARMPVEYADFLIGSQPLAGWGAVGKFLVLMRGVEPPTY